MVTLFELLDDRNMDEYTRRLAIAELFHDIRMNSRLHNAKNEGEARGLKKGKAEGLKKGKAEGLKKGKAEGIKEGKKEGIKEGKKAASLEYAKNLKVLGISFSDIAAAIGLSIAEIEKL